MPEDWLIDWLVIETSLTKIWMDKSFTFKTKIMIFSKALYGDEHWILKQREEKRIQSFEIWCNADDITLYKENMGDLEMN